MADENTETKASPAPTTTQAATGTPPAAGTGGTSGAGGKADAKADAGKADDAGSPQTVEIGDDEYPVDAKGNIVMSASTLKRRMGRYSKKQLMDTFGTDDVNDLKARLDEHGKLKAQSEDQRKKQLAKEEQLAEDLAKERDKSARAEARANQLAEEREYQQADSEVRTTAEKHIKAGKPTKLAVYEFGEYVRDLDEDEAAKLKPKDVDAWFRQYAEDNQEFAKGAKEPEPKKEAKPGERKPLSHGAGDAGAAPRAASATDAKTAKPGQSNSMTDAEYRKFKHDQGLSG